MPTHLRDLPRCDTCNAPATAELRNTYNAPLGTYCSRHAKAALRQQQAAEQRR